VFFCHSASRFLRSTCTLTFNFSPCLSPPLSVILSLSKTRSDSFLTVPCSAVLIMRTLALVGLKLLGIWCLCQVVQGATGVVSGFRLGYLIAHPLTGGRNFTWLITLPTASIGINLFVGFVLLLRTEWIVAKLGIPSDPVQLSVTASDLLRLSLVAGGIIVAIEAFSEVASGLCLAFQAKTSPEWYGGGTMITGGLTKLIVTYIVIRASKRISAAAFPAAPAGP